MRVTMVAAAITGLLLAGSATARDRTGFQSIAAGDLVGAERTLVAERRIFPDRPELMLNLAAVYERTGRTADARVLLQRAAVAPAVAMDLPDGRVASSQMLAAAGLSRLATAQVAAR